MLWPLLIFGCGGLELSQSWQLDRVRILAVRPFVDVETDPVLGTRAEPEPGETVRFEALTYAPPDEPVGGVLWSACLLDDAIGQCDFESDDLDESGLTEDGSGIIGIEPFLNPTWNIPADALDSLTDTEKQEGRSALINVIAIPEDIFEDEDLFSADTDKTDQLSELDPNAFEIAFKRMPISLAETPNHNPDIVNIVVAGHPIGSAKGFTARTKKTYTLEPILANGHIETYAFINNSGEKEYRTEEPYFSWYTELGAEDPKKGAEFDQPVSLYPYSSVEWTAPDKPGWITIYVVARDRRGGMGWRTISVNVL